MWRSALRANAERNMCEKCGPIDEQIERYQRLAKRTYDRRTLDLIERLLGELKTKKLLLHPNE
jgi:hypothetical protein